MLKIMARLSQSLVFVFLILNFGCPVFAQSGLTQSGLAQSGIKQQADPKNNQKLEAPIESAEKSGEKPVEPFEIDPEFMSKKEEIEPPEIEVTGIMETAEGIMAIVKLDLEDYEGTAILEPGQRVSMPNPKSSVADKWISYFTVKKITGQGIVLVLENGREAYFPVLGSRN